MLKEKACASRYTCLSSRRPRATWNLACSDLGCRAAPCLVCDTKRGGPWGEIATKMRPGGRVILYDAMPCVRIFARISVYFTNMFVRVIVLQRHRYSVSCAK